MVYVDESGFEGESFRTHGYATRGQPCYGIHNWHKQGKRCNAIGALGKQGLFALRLFDGAVDSDVFYAWVTQALLVELTEKSVIVMDNAAFHKRKDIVEAIEREGHVLLWLPPYSPDLNPIEKLWAWIKSLRKKWRLDDVDALFFWFFTIISIL